MPLLLKAVQVRLCVQNASLKFTVLLGPLKTRSTAALVPVTFTAAALSLPAVPLFAGSVHFNREALAKVVDPPTLPVPVSVAPAATVTALPAAREPFTASVPALTLVAP